MLECVTRELATPVGVRTLSPADPGYCGRYTGNVTALGDDAHVEAERERAAARMFPAFVATALGEPAYFQLAGGTADEIRTGAEDGAEMGVWRHLRQPQREDNLRTSLITYLRFGLEAGGFFAT